MSIREICKLTEYDPSNWSKIERGLISPPSDEETLNKWGEILNLNKEDLNDFINQAHLAKGVIPENLLEKEEILHIMPAFFRTFKNRKPTKEEIDKLVNLIKNT